MRIARIRNVRLHRCPDSPIRWVDISVHGDTIQDIVEAPVPTEQVENNKAAPTATVSSWAKDARVEFSEDIVNGNGAFVIPGLINLHSHLFRKLRPGEEFGSRYNRVAATIRALRNAQDYLDQGVTTVRELGAPEDLDIALATLVSRGLVIAPRIFAAGRPLTQTGGHNYQFGVVVDGPFALRQAVRERVLAGAEWIKLMASQGGTRYFVSSDSSLPPEDSDEAKALVEQIIRRADPEKSYAATERDGYTLEELQAAADEARRQGIGTAAHAVTAQSVINVVKAGVNTVEHATFLSPEAAKILADSDSVYVPTASTAFYRIVYGRQEGWPDYLLRWAMFVAEPWFAALRLAREYGLTVATGTDAGGHMHMEMQLLERAGFTRYEVLQAATQVAAQVLGRPDLGCIATGAKADIALVKGDPLENLSVLEKPLLTIKGGQIYRDCFREA